MNRKRMRLPVLFLCCCLLAAVLPRAAAAEWQIPYISLGTSRLSNGSTVWFGSAGNPIAWRVLSPEGEQKSPVSKAGEILLISRSILEKTIFNNHDDKNTWAGSKAQAWCAALLSRWSADSIERKNVIKKTSVTETEEYTIHAHGQDAKYGPVSLTDESFFFLSAKEANTLFSNDTDRKASGAQTTWWWLRSPNTLEMNDANIVYDAGYVEEDGTIYNFREVNNTFGARPAFNLNPEAVLFVSGADKKRTRGEPGEIAIIEGGGWFDWKLTLKDNSRTFRTTVFSVTAEQGGQITIPYTNAKTGSNEYISVLLCDSSSGTPLCYGSVLASSEGEAVFTLPNWENLGSREYTLRVFNEQKNGDWETDYASDFREVSLTVTPRIAKVIYQVTGEIPPGAPEAPKTTDVAAGTTVTVAPDLTLKGYDFSGWDNPFAMIRDGKFTMPDWDVTLTGSWQAHTHSLEIDYRYENGKKAAETYTATLKYGEEYKVDSPEIKGYTADPISVSGKMEEEDISTAVTYRMAFCEVTFDANEVTGVQMPEDRTLRQYSEMTLEAAVPPLGGTHAFQGWSINSQAEEPEFKAGETYVFAKDTTLYAIWQEVSPEATLEFRDPLPDPVSGMPGPITVYPSASLNVLLPDDVPQKSGRVYTGWNTEADGSGTAYAPGSTFTLTGDTVLYAIWQVAQDSWYIVYNANGGKGAPAGQVIPIGQDAVLSSEKPYSMAVFKGWSRDPEADKAEYWPGDRIAYKADVSSLFLYAVWEFAPVQRPVYITFDANGKTGVKMPENKWIERDGWLTLEAAVPPLGGTTTFLGWSTDSQATQPEYEAGETYVFTEDTALYAIWQEVSPKATLEFRDPLPDPVSGMPGPITVYPSASLNVLLPDDVPTKSGRVFTGWNTEADGSGTAYAPGSTFTLTGDTVLYAMWQVAQDSWYIVYNANGGKGAPAGQVIPIGQDAVLSSDKPYSMAVFKGWSRDPEADKAEYRPGDKIAYQADVSSLFLYAVWEFAPVQRPVHVTFDANGATSVKMPENKWIERSGWLTLEAAVPPLGGTTTFLGWSTDSQAAEPEFKAGAMYVFAEDTTLYAVWQEVSPRATLEFRDPLPDPVSGMPGTITVYPSASLNVLLPDDVPTKSGRVFTGWNTEADGSGTSYAPGGTIFLTGDTVLYAMWEIGQNSWYIVYNANGGKGAPAGQVIPIGQDTVLSSEKPYSMAVFKGWSRDPEADKAEYRPGDRIAYRADVSSLFLYAVWEFAPVQRPVYITFDANGKTGVKMPENKWIERDGWLTLEAAVPPLGGTTTFLGWSRDSKATQPEYEAGETYVFTEDTALYAVWGTADWKVTLEFRDSGPEGAMNLPGTITVYLGMSPNVLIPDTLPEKDGNAFMAWNTAADGSGTPVTPGDRITLSRDLILYAQWEKVQYSWSIIYNANGGKDAPAGQVIPAGQNAILSGEKPVYEGMTFEGWALDRKAETAEYQPGNVLPYDSGKTTVVLYAVWTETPVIRILTVSFDPNGEDVRKMPESITAPVLTWVTLPTGRPERDPQHLFLGWDPDPEASDPRYSAGSAEMFSRDTVLYAVWEVRYRITEGAGSVWKKGSEVSLRFRADGKLAYFAEVRIDGKILGREEYQVSSGSTVIDLRAETLEHLPVGKHSLEVVYKDGSAAAEFHVTGSLPPTGDREPLWLWGALLLLGIAGIVWTLISRRRRKTYEK